MVMGTVDSSGVEYSEAGLKWSGVEWCGTEGKKADWDSSFVEEMGMVIEMKMAMGMEMGMGTVDSSRVKWGWSGVEWKKADWVAASSKRRRWRW